MKIHLHIVSYFLLAAMFLSLFQYVPVGDDGLSLLDKTELAKKAKENSENDVDDEDPDADSEDDYIDNGLKFRLSINFDLGAYAAQNSFYSFLLINKHTPPPKFQA